MTPAIIARDLTFLHRTGRGVRELSLQVKAGACFAILGPNGSGKTTLTRLLMGNLRPALGQIEVLGVPVDRRPRGHLSLCGAAWDRPVHWEQLSGRQNAVFTGRAYGMAPAEIRSRLGELLDRADLADQADEPVSAYSFGMRRKLSILQAMLHDPDLLVLDEPTAGVDAKFLAELTGLLRERTRAGRTTWLVGNDAEFFAGVAGRVGFLHAGRLIGVRTVAEWIAGVRALREIRVELAGPHAVERPRFEGVQAFRQHGPTVTVLVDRDPALVGRTVAWIADGGADVREVTVRGATLRDSYLQAVGRTDET